jgi:crotonobetainyl-CoA:carnitine CoA-transferase CaiB-like acyl-CoA transferase
MTPTTPRDALAHIWGLGGGDPAALERVELTGSEPALPSSFAVGTQAQATIAASALAAAEVWRQRTGEAQRVSVDMRHAAVEFRSERYLSVDGHNLRMFDPLFGVYRASDGRWVRIHTNFPHHRAGMLAMLGAENTRESVVAKISKWQGQAFEDEAAARGLVATLTRSPQEWHAHPQGQALATLPLFDIIRIGDAPPRRRTADGKRPLSDVKVLDLTRVIAGPVCGRTLAVHGADVLAVSGPNLPFSQQLIMDNGRGKLQAHLELTDAADREKLASLARSADIFVQGYRPGAIASKGFAPEQVAALSPGVVCVSLSAYGHAGPWSGRRGFDSLVQNTNGLNYAEAEAAGTWETEGPRELPAQALDHASGFLLATGAMMALKRQAEMGGSWLVRVSLAQTGRWLEQLGRVENGFSAANPGVEDVGDRLDVAPSGFGPMTAVRHAAHLAATPAHYERPSVPLGTHPAAWPVRAV